MTISVANMTAFRSTVFIGLGSNLEDPMFQVQRGMRAIDEIDEVTLVRLSSLYETAPVGKSDQPAFVNAVVQVETLLSPHDLLAEFAEIEKRHGRIRSDEKFGPRTLDLDILIFNEWRIAEDNLVIPHPRMHERAFVLVPLVEIAPEVYIPGKGYAKDFLSALDAGGVRRLTDSDGEKQDSQPEDAAG